MRPISMMVGIALTATPALAEPSYLCVAEKAVGFVFENGRWDVARLRPNKKWVVRKSKSLGEEDVSWRVFDFGKSAENDWVIAECRESEPFLFCHAFQMNTKNLRSLYIYDFGYVDGKDNNDNNPAMYIGTCTVL